MMMMLMIVVAMLMIDDKNINGTYQMKLKEKQMTNEKKRYNENNEEKRYK